MNKKERDKGK